MPLLLQNPMFVVGSKASTKGPRSPGPMQQPYQVVMALSFSCENLRNHLEESSPPPLDEESRILILDCRTFMAHSDRHIVGAVNVQCPAILRRRLGNKPPLRTVITDREVRERLRKGGYSPIVLYEESASAGPNSMAAFVARCLQNEARINNVYILEGGFQQFYHQYPHLCVTEPKNPGVLMTPGSPSYWPTALSPLSSLSRSSSSPSLASTKNLPWYQQDQQDPVEILPYLFLGSEYHASNRVTLQRLKITALLNVSHNCPNHFEDLFRYMTIPIEDSTSEDIGIWFRKAIEFINDVNSTGGKVLVHCHAGISRSATICMAYLMATLRLRMEDAYEHVKARRKIISPNFSFMGQLLSFESQVLSPRPAQRSPRSPLTSIPCNNNNSTQASPSPRVDSPKTPSEGTAFDFSISPSTLASLVNSSTAGSASSPSPTPSPTTPLCPSSPYTP